MSWSGGGKPLMHDAYQVACEYIRINDHIRLIQQLGGKPTVRLAETAIRLRERLDYLRPPESRLGRAWTAGRRAGHW